MSDYLIFVGCHCSPRPHDCKWWFTIYKLFYIVDIFASRCLLWVPNRIYCWRRKPSSNTVPVLSYITYYGKLEGRNDWNHFFAIDSQWLIYLWQEDLDHCFTGVRIYVPTWRTVHGFRKNQAKYKTNQKNQIHSLIFLVIKQLVKMGLHQKTCMYCAVLIARYSSCAALWIG